MRPVTNRLFLAVILITIAFSSCKEFIEPDISDRTVTLNAPGDKFQSKSYSVNFWWEEVEDAIAYRVQIVTPDFDHPASLIRDTLVKGNKFITSLEPGTYAWHVRAENGSSHTAYTAPRSFDVLFSSIKQQKARLLLPGDAALTNASKLSLSWESLYGATKYRLQVDTNNFTDTTKLFLDLSTPAQQFDLSLSKDQIYKWRVRAENDTAKAQWSVINNFTFDHTPPGVVTLTNPLNNQAATSPVALQWNTTTTAAKYKIYVFKADSTSIYNSNFPVTVTATSYSFTSGTMGDRVYWKVAAIDAAGNEGIASKMRNFTIQ